MAHKQIFWLIVLTIAGIFGNTTTNRVYLIGKTVDASLHETADITGNIVVNDSWLNNSISSGGAGLGNSNLAKSATNEDEGSTGDVKKDINSGLEQIKDTVVDDSWLGKTSEVNNNNAK